MDLKFKLIIASGLLFCGLSSSQAALISSGTGLVYDTVLDITWLQDAHLAATEKFNVAGIESDGQMTWDVANNWIAALNDSNYMGYSNWRMPTVTPINGSSWNLAVTYDGSSDKGYNNYSTSNEMSHLFYNTLGNLGYCNVNGACGGGQNGYSQWGLVNTGSFTNFTGVDRYWTEVENPTNSSRAFDFSFEHGQTGTGNKGGTFFVWAVMDGNVANLSVVPVPAAVWLFCSGLLGFITIGLGKQKQR